MMAVKAEQTVVRKAVQRAGLWALMRVVIMGHWMVVNWVVLKAVMKAGLKAE